jgi:hypothetical protein
MQAKWSGLFVRADHCMPQLDRRAILSKSVEENMVKDKLYLGSVEVAENDYNVKVYAILNDPDVEGPSIGVALEFHLVRDTNDMGALEKKALAKAETILKKLLVP